KASSRVSWRCSKSAGGPLSEVVVAAPAAASWLFWRLGGGVSGAMGSPRICRLPLRLASSGMGGLEKSKGADLISGEKRTLLGGLMGCDGPVVPFWVSGDLGVGNASSTAALE